MLLVGAPARAQFLWSGASTAIHNWSDPTNWDGNNGPPSGVLPGATFLNGGTNVHIDGSTTIGELYFGSPNDSNAGSSFTFDGDTLTLAPSFMIESIHIYSPNAQTINNPIVLSSVFGRQTWTARSSLTLGGTLDLGGTALTLEGGVSAPAFTFSNVISGAGTLFAHGDLLVFGAANTFTGSVTLSSSSVRLDHGLGLQYNALTADGGTLTFGSAVTSATIGSIDGPIALNLTNQNAQPVALTLGGNNASTALSQTISGSGSLIKTGAGALTLSAANTFTGGTTINGGLIEFSALENFGTGHVTLDGGGARWASGTSTDLSPRLNALGSGGGTFDTNGSDVTFSTALAGPGALTKTGAGTLTLAPGSTYAGGTTIRAGVIEFGSGGALGTGNLTLDGGALRWASGTSTDISARLNPIGAGGATFDTNGNDVSFITSISGSGALVKNGAGMLTLTGDNTVGGMVTLNAGALAITGAFTAGGIALNGGSLSVGGTIGIGAAGLSITSDTTLSNPIVLAAATQTWSVPNGTSLTLTGNISGGDISDLLNFTSPNFPGGTITLSGQSTFQFNQIDISRPLTLALGSSATFDADLNVTSGPLGLQDGVVLTAGASGFRLRSTDTTARTITVITTRALPFLIRLGDTDPAHNGALSISAIGVTSNNGGPPNLLTLQVDSPVSLNGVAGGASLIKTGLATLTFEQSFGFGLFGVEIDSGTLASANLFGNGLGPGTVKFAGGTFQALASYSLTNPTRLGSAGTIDTPGGITLGWNGNITGGGVLTKTGAGTLVLGTSNSFSGTTTVNSGTLQLGADGALPNGTPVSVVSGATLDLNHHPATLGSLTGAGNINTGGAALTLAQATDTTFTGVIGGGGGLNKTGAGTLILTGANTYTGATTVDAGLFVVNGSLANTALAINPGGTLGGSGSIGGLTTLASDAHLAPGNSPGTLTFTNGLTLAAGSAFDFQLGTTSDLIRVSGGTLTGPSSGTVTFNLSDAGGFAAGNYTLFDFNGAGTSNFVTTAFTLGTTISGYDYSFALNGSALELTATASAIPEPSTCAAIFGALAFGAAAVREHRRRKLAA